MTTDPPPTLYWIRRDLRLGDNPAWAEALAGGGPVIPVFILDPVIEEGYGAAPKWRLEQGLASHARALAARGSRLVLRRGPALETLRDLIRGTGAARVVWSRLYDGAARDRDARVKAALKAEGVATISVNAALLFEPWTVETGSNGFYKVYTPFWKAVRGREVAAPDPAPRDLRPPRNWPASDRLGDWGLGRAMNRGAAVVAAHAIVGEDAAAARLDRFLDGPIARYAAERDRMDIDATSRLGQNLATGEIGPRTLWHAARAAMEGGAAGAETFLKELVWREFAHHLLYHTPRIESENWREDWDAFPWEGDSALAERWRRAMTGIEIVDAAMREMYVTGTMHNRARMLVASLLTKHMLTHWRIGEAWFRDCLIDWDPAANALGWQWAAGSGPDAAPYFRIFNPETQAAKFDPDRAYRDRWIAEGRRRPHADALSYFEAVPRSWGLDPAAPYPDPVVGLKQGRERALAAYHAARAGA